MKYVLKQSINSNEFYYVYSDSLIHDKLSQAKIFNTLSEIEHFHKQNAWTESYRTIKITKAALFKAKLANQ